MAIQPSDGQVMNQRIAQRCKLKARDGKIVTIDPATAAVYIWAASGHALSKPRCHNEIVDRNETSTRPAILDEVRRIAVEQAERRNDNAPPLPAADVLRRLLAAAQAGVQGEPPAPYVWSSKYGRPALSVQSVNR